MLEVLQEALIDSLKLLPFLFIAYLAMGIFERATSDKSKRLIQEAGKIGPLWGAILGAFPQCGFSAAAANFYVGRMISLGTLIAIYLSTSDEMLPILISEKVSGSVIIKILLTKMVIGMVSGFFIELLFGWMAKRNLGSNEFSFNHDDHHKHCNCGAGLIFEAVSHTVKVFVFILISSAIIGTIIHFVGEENLQLIFADIPIVGEMISAFVGLIPNCAASVVITQLYLDGIIGAGPMISGLCVSAGVGLLVLFKENKHLKENLIIIGMLYTVSVVWGIIITTFGITF